MAAHDLHHHDRHGHVHRDEADWPAMVEQVELEGEVLLRFLTDTATWITELRGPAAPAVRVVLDIGSGPGVGTCELAIRFPDAHVIAVDSSLAMLERARRRATAHGLGSRISTHLAELPGGLDGLERADLIWASMSLHHVGDEVTALRVLRDLTGPDGLLAIAELAEPMRVLPADLDVGRPGLADRLDRAAATWFARMRDALPHPVPSMDLGSMLAAAGFEVVGSRVVRERLDAPLSGGARRMARGSLRRACQQFAEHLDDDDLHALAVLSDDHDPRSVMHRSDVVVTASRQIAIARPVGGSASRCRA
jgi:SAM-dependent methyltransferase